ncbi:MAG: peptidase T [Gemmataceae bacterium]|nr:peptidase T [Gemmataceae bacterium]
MESKLLNRFCRYVRVDTQADEMAKTYPSSPGQLALGKILKEEMESLGAQEVVQTGHGIVYATIPATVQEKVPVIAWLAHMDTSPETSGKNVQPVVHPNYDGRDLVLPGDRAQLILVRENPELASMVGKTLITTDGTTLLGADNKAGVAVIMEAMTRLLTNPGIPHGKIRVCFTCDEEIGKGVDHLDLKFLGAVAAYTLDGGGQGEIDTETFSADLATVRINGVNIHPSIAKNRMTNAVRIAGKFLTLLPWDSLSPETTEGKQGFMHPYHMEGGVAQITLKILLRDFETQGLRQLEIRLKTIAGQLQQEYPSATIDVQVTKQYRNMADGMEKEPRAIAFAIEAMKRAGIEPKVTSVRGGTDGSRLTELGLPTPNLSTGEHNPHSPLEWTCLEEMETAARVLVELAQVWREKGK